MKVIAAVAAAFAFTVATTALNFIYLAAMVIQGYGFQIMSAFAVAFGVYIAMSQWTALRSSFDARPASS